jgi:hypothetical protein
MEEPKRRKTSEHEGSELGLDQPGPMLDLRRESFVSASVVSDEPSIEQSKEWINTYLEGGHDEDDFQRKYFEGGLKVDPVSPSTQAIQILKEELLERVLPQNSDPDRIIETYEEVVSPPIHSLAERRKMTCDNLPDREEPASNRTNKSVERVKKSTENSKESNHQFDVASLIQGGDRSSQVFQTPKSLPQVSSPNEIVDIPTPEMSKTSGVLPTLIRQRSKSNEDAKSNPVPPERILTPLAPVLTTPGPTFRLHPKIKIKIFDLSLVRLQFMNKSDDEVRNNFLKTLQVKQKMPEIFSPKPHAKEQKSKRGLILVIIFDWDDTLFCTSYLSSLGYNRKSDLSEKEHLLFKKVDESAVD